MSYTYAVASRTVRRVKRPVRLRPNGASRTTSLPPARCAAGIERRLRRAQRRPRRCAIAGRGQRPAAKEFRAGRRQRRAAGVPPGRPRTHRDGDRRSVPPEEPGRSRHVTSGVLPENVMSSEPGAVHRAITRSRSDSRPPAAASWKRSPAPRPPGNSRQQPRSSRRAAALRLWFRWRSGVPVRAPTLGRVRLPGCSGGCSGSVGTGCPGRSDP